jgi:hypothetical protein
MTKRNDLTYNWATAIGSHVVDAETDVDHPSGLGGPGKTARGWVTEVEPQEWENFNLKLRDDRIKAVMQNGRVPYDDEVSYKVGALCYLTEVLYVSLANANLNNDPITATTFWSPVRFTSLAEYLATLASMTGSYTSHTVPGLNSHNDTIDNIGGYDKETIDGMATDGSDGIGTHAARKDNPHIDTAALVGTVAIAGGDFTGRVNYTGSLSVGTNCELMVNTSTFVSFRSNTGAIGLGVADYHTGGRWQHILTAGNFPSISATFNKTFVMPKPDLHFPLMSNLNPKSGNGELITFTRNSTLGYTDKSNNAQTAAINTPAFEVPGLKLSGATSMVVAAKGLLGSRDGCVSYTLNNVVVVRDMQFVNQELTYYFGTSGNVKNFRVWSQRLTPRQKLRIPR